MAQVDVRNLTNEVVARLKVLLKAARQGREEVLADMDRIRAMTPDVPQTDSAELICENRDLGWR